MYAGHSERPTIRMGDLVTLGQDGPIMRVARVEDSVAVCLWRAKHHVREIACSTQALLKVAPGRLLPIWGHWGGGGGQNRLTQLRRSGR